MEINKRRLSIQIFFQCINIGLIMMHIIKYTVHRLTCSILWFFIDIRVPAMFGKKTR